MQLRTRRPAAPRALAELVRASGNVATGHIRPDVRVSGLATDSRVVEPGDLFVATVGGSVDGHRYLAEAAARGAVAAVVERDPEPCVQLPLVRVANSRIALAELAAAWNGHPALGLPLVGITGTMGKTSTLSFLERILLAAGQRVGSVGSLGVRLDARTLAETGFTVPAPIHLHQALRDLRGGGCGMVLMEATTHALTQGRLHGIEYDLGIFTGLVPLEHMEYHASFQEYARAKLRYFEHLRRGAPLVYFADCPVLAKVIPERDVLGVACGTGETAALRMRVERIEPRGTSLRLRAERGLPRLDGSVSQPFEVALTLPLVGRSAAVNAMLAAGAAIVAGAPVAAVRSSLEGVEPVARRMQVVQVEPFAILDDYGGHPDTVSAVFEVVGALRWRRLHVLSGYRGSRGVRINRAMARALGAWLRRTGYASVCLTAAEETSDARNLAMPEEMRVFETALRREGIRFAKEPRLDAALEHLLPRIEGGDLLVILGTQGVDGAAALARRRWSPSRSTRARERGTFPTLSPES